MAAGSQLVESLGEKAGPGPAREKNPFFLRSHAVQLARVSPLTETPSLTSSNSSPEIRPQTEKLLDRYENGRVGRAKAAANAP